MQSPALRGFILLFMLLLHILSQMQEYSGLYAGIP